MLLALDSANVRSRSYTILPDCECSKLETAPPDNGAPRLSASASLSDSRRVTPNCREARFPKAEPLASLCILSSRKKVWARPGLRGEAVIRRILF